MYVLLLIGMILQSTFVSATPGAGEPMEQVREAAVQALSQNFPETASTLQVRVERVGSDLSAASEVRVSFPATDAVPRARTRVDLLERKPEGAWAKTGWAILYVAHFDSVVTAMKGLDADQPISLSDLTYAWVETTRFNGDPLKPSDLRAQVGEVFATRRIREGDVLRTSDIRPEYIARTGDQLYMRYQRGSLLLNLSCKAREHGFEQDVIRVYSSDTSTMYRARLVAPGVAEWVETL